jgi:hypothetical protein
MPVKINYEVSGVAMAWKALCANIVSQTTLYDMKLQDSAEITKATAIAYENQAQYQYNQLQDKKNELISTGTASVVAGTTAAVIELGTLAYSFRLDNQADGLENAQETNNVQFTEEPVMPSTSRSSPGRTSTGTDAGVQPDEAHLDTARSTVAELPPESPTSSVRADTAHERVVAGDESVDLDVQQTNTRTQQKTSDLDADETKEAVDQKNAKDISEKRNMAKSLRDLGTGLGQAVLSIGNGIGQLASSYYTNQEADDTRMATLFQAAETVLQTILQQIQAMEQASDSSAQGTYQTFSSIIAANVIRG